jgi:ParB/RepB/Spo0J family partition protein
MPKDTATKTPVEQATADNLRRTTAPLSALRSSKLNPRKAFDQEKIATLAESILAEGILQNLVVRQGEQSNTFEIVAGEYRFRAVKSLVDAGKVAADYPVPILVRTLNDADVLVLAMAENMARRDMTPLEEANGFKALRERKLSTAEIAASVGVTQRLVQQRLGLLDKLTPETRNALAKGEISVTQARALTIAPAKEQKKLVAEIKERRNYEGEMTEAQIKEIITEDSVDAAHVIFDLKLYKGEQRVDEDTGITYLTDTAQVAKLTEAHIEAQVADLKKEHGDDKVVVLDSRRNGYFHAHMWRQSKKDPNAVVVVQIIQDGGKIEVHEGLVPAEKLKTTAAGPQPQRKTKRTAAESFTSAHRAHAHRRKTHAMQRAVMADHAHAMRLVIASALQGGFDPVLVTLDGRDSYTKTDRVVRIAPELAESLNTQLAKCRAAKLKATAADGIKTPASYAPSLTARAAAVWKWLNGLKGKPLEQLFAAVVAANVGTWPRQGVPLADTDEAVLVAASLGLKGHEHKHNLALTVADLDGLRRDALFAISQELKIKDVTETTGRADLVDAIKAKLKELGDKVDYVLPTLQFNTEAPMTKDLGALLKG